MQKFFTLVGLLKYGLVTSAILIYLPFTVLYQVPGHDMTGNMFVELPARGVFFGTIFLLATVWSIMFTQGLIINGHENRFDKHKPFYRSLDYIKDHPSEYIPAAADRFFSIAVTGAQFFWFTVVLAGPSLYFFVWWADHRILALAAALAGFLFDYLLFIVACTPSAVLNPGDPLLRNFPLAKTIWSTFGYEAKDKPTRAYRFFVALQQGISWISPHYRLDKDTHLIYPAHFQATIFLVVLLLFWIVFNWAAYPGRTFFSIESAPVVYIYASLLLFVGSFAVLDLNLGPLHISPIAALLIFVIVGYSIFSIDHEYGVTREESKTTRITPVDAAKNSGPNLVVVASAGGGIWAAG